MQPIYRDVEGTHRFKRNAIVRYLLDMNGQGAKIDMNTLSMVEFSQEDREQFAQLIGYSVGGFEELSYVRPATIRRVEAEEKRLRALRPAKPTRARRTGR